MIGISVARAAADYGAGERGHRESNQATKAIARMGPMVTAPTVRISAIKPVAPALASSDPGRWRTAGIDPFALKSCARKTASSSPLDTLRRAAILAVCRSVRTARSGGSRPRLPVPESLLAFGWHRIKRFNVVQNPSKTAWSEVAICELVVDTPTSGVAPP